MTNNLIDNRQIRVFISSTFRDMQDERDYLMKRTFPKLRKLAAERDVTLTELDLRWGITEEESKSGKVVEICLREIENSIPFFIGIIGNRYGWVPAKEDLGGNVTERFTDVNKYIDQHLSVTEMEMQFGVLSREEDMHAYFYIKEQEEDADNLDMLNRLKEEVRQSKYPSTTYSSPENLAMQVEEAFIALLDQLFPQTNLSELEKERIGQRSFMNQLCQNYIKDERNFTALEAWLADEDSRQYVVTGASGLGKSALIANWVKDKLNDSECKYNIIYHFTGNGGSESNCEHITKSLVNEINDIYGWEDSDADAKLDDLFVRLSTEDKPLLIVIDAINQIVDVDNAKLLNWLPAPTKNIKILFSTLEDDRTMEVFKNRNYPIFILLPLDVDRRSLLVKNYLKLYAKTLTEKQVERIVTDSQCENTLVLKTLLDELINFGIYEKLDDRIDYYLASETINDFYQLLLETYETEYQVYGVNFVKDILSIIALSREGLSENEIISINDIKKQVQWSQFFCQFNRHLLSKNGFISFSHSYIFDAVAKRYLYVEKNVSEYRERLIAYFSKFDTTRAWVETSWQYYNNQNYEKLHDLISYLDVFQDLYDSDAHSLALYWNKLKEINSDKYTLLPIISDASKNSNIEDAERNVFLQKFCDFCSFYHHDDEALDYATASLFLINEKTPVHSILYRIYRNEYLHNRTSEENTKGLEDYLLYLEENNGQSNHQTLEVYDLLVKYYLQNNQIHSAYKLINKITDIYNNELINEPSLYIEFLNMKGQIYSRFNDNNNGLCYKKEALEQSISLFGNTNLTTATQYNNLGIAYSEVGEIEKSISYINKAIDIRLKLLGEYHPLVADCYYNIATILSETNDFSQIVEYYQKSIDIYSHIYGEDHDITYRPYIVIGSILSRYYNALGLSFEDAVEYNQLYLNKSIELFGEIHVHTMNLYHNLSTAYYMNNDITQAIKLEKLALDVALHLFSEDCIEIDECNNNIEFLKTLL